MSAQGIPVSAGEPRGRTFPQMLRTRATGVDARRDALRQKRYGRWRCISWAAYFISASEVARALIAGGLRAGEAVAVLSKNREEWVYAELGIQSAGGVVLGLYPEAAADEIVPLLRLAEVRTVFAEDQEQVDKLAAAAALLDRTLTIVFFDGKGLELAGSGLLVHFDAFRSSGTEAGTDLAARLDRRLEAGRAGDVAMLAVTSGTTGPPKLAMVSYASMTYMAAGVDEIDPKRAGDNYLSFLPMAWMGEQMTVVSCHLAAGFTVNFPENAETLRQDLVDIAPDFLVGPPRFWQALMSRIQAGVETSTRFKRAAYAAALPQEYRLLRGRETARDGGPPTGPGTRLLAALAEWTVMRPLRDQLGLPRVRIAMNGGGSLGPDTVRYFHALGIPLKQIYGQTELCGISCLHRREDIRFHTVGAPLTGTEIRISLIGEVLTRSPAMFKGYLANDDASREAVEDGWLKSGDAGYFDRSGQLVVMDRLKNMVTMADGEKFSPQHIEDKLKFYPAIQEAVVVGAGRPCLVALIVLNGESVSLWAEARKISFTTYRDLASLPEVYEFVAQSVAAVNRELPAKLRIRKFVVLHKELDADDGELTRTNKVRRGAVVERYASIFDALYGDGDRISVESVVTYQSGKSRRQEIALPIRSLP